MSCLSVCLSVRMEGGELFNRVKAGHGLDEAVAKLYFYQMLMAVEVRRRVHSHAGRSEVVVSVGSQLWCWYPTQS